MKITITVFCILFFAGVINLYGQNERIFESPEEPAVFPWGETELFKFIGENLNYVFEKDTIITYWNFSFLVDSLGVAKFDSLQKDYAPIIESKISKELARVINSMPTWEPGKVDGKNITTRIYFPILVDIQE